MSAERRKVLITGATGVVASQLLPAFRDAYDLRLVDLRTTDREGREVASVEVADLLEQDRERLVELFAGVDTVVHCAYLPPAGEPTYAEERRNVDLMQRVYDVALEAGVRRVVAASTNQASKWYERPWFEGRIDRVGPEDYPRPDNLYGWAKAAYESLGFLYACGGFGRQLEVVQLRIVVPREVSATDFEGRPLQRYLRDIAGYISERDLQQLFMKSVEAESVDDPHGVPFQIFYGVSNNARTFWSITNAREVIGYDPVDDSETKFVDEIATMLARGSDPAP